MHRVESDRRRVLASGFAGGRMGRLHTPHVVAIPARNEEDRIGRCLDALFAQDVVEISPPFGVVLLLNNCDDATAQISRERLAMSGAPYLIADTTLSGPHASAGYARGLAMDIAAQWIADEGYGDGVILTTDADSAVSRHWIGRNLSGLASGCDAVAGRVRLDVSEDRSLPAALRERGELERRYERALLQVAARVDPVPHDPWPNHWTASGASYALTLKAYREVGGLPDVANGEDHALTEMLHRHDLRIRHDPDIVVTTSARLEGRATGGVAEALRCRCADPLIPGDDRLEPFASALFRYSWRGRIRRWRSHGGARPARLRTELELPEGFSLRGDPNSFGALWGRIEKASPLLARRALRPSELPANIALARATLNALNSIQHSPTDTSRFGLVEQHAPMVEEAARTG
jgi:hypothetical protein